MSEKRSLRVAKDVTSAAAWDAAGGTAWDAAGAAEMDLAERRANENAGGGDKTWTSVT